MRFLTLVIGVFGVAAVQLIVKYRLNVEHGPAPVDASLLPYFVKILGDIWLWGAGVLLVAAALLWYFSLSRMPLSIAISFAALVYPLVMLGSATILGEAVRLPQIAGCGFIVAGIWLVAYSA